MSGPEDFDPEKFKEARRQAIKNELDGRDTTETAATLRERRSEITILTHDLSSRIRDLEIAKAQGQSQPDHEPILAGLYEQVRSLLAQREEIDQKLRDFYS